MAVYGSDDVAFILIGGFNLLTNTMEMNDNLEAVTEETTVLGDSWQQHAYVGLKRGEVTINGFFDDAAKASVDALSTRHGTERILAYGVAGNTVGKPFTGFSGAVELNVSRVASRGALHKLNTQFKGSGIVDEGLIHRAWSSATASTGNTQAASIDGGASSTLGGVGHFQLSDLAMDGTSTGFTASIRDSADNNTFAALLNFSQVTSSSLAPTAQRSTTLLSTAIQRYTAVAWAYSSTVANSSQNAQFMVGFQRY